MKSWRNPCCVVFALCLLGAAEKPAVVTSTDLVCALESAVNAGPPGVSAALATSESVIWSGAAGHADLRLLVPATPDHLFGIGSITKTFIAVVTLQLVEEGKLALTDTPADILGSQVEAVANSGQAEISHLLNHTSGIPSWEDDPRWIREGRGAALETAKKWSKTEALAFVAGSDHRPLFTPGQDFSYSNSNYTLLGLMIEKVTGNDIVEEIETRIRKPHGLSSIYLEGFEPVPKEQLAQRYHYNTDTFARDAGVNAAFDRVSAELIDVTPSNLSTEWTAGGMVARARDLAKFAQALRGGHFLSLESQQYLFDWRPIESAGIPLSVGHGLFRATTPTGVWIGHSGSVLGYTGYMGWLENADLIVVVLSNAGSMHVGGGVMTSARIATDSSFSRLALRYGEQTLGGADPADDVIHADLCAHK